MRQVLNCNEIWYIYDGILYRVFLHFKPSVFKKKKNIGDTV